MVQRFLTTRTILLLLKLWCRPYIYLIDYQYGDFHLLPMRGCMKCSFHGQFFVCVSYKILCYLFNPEVKQGKPSLVLYTNS